MTGSGRSWASEEGWVSRLYWIACLSGVGFLSATVLCLTAGIDRGGKVEPLSLSDHTD